jgi:hypothetical protein
MSIGSTAICMGDSANEAKSRRSGGSQATEEVQRWPKGMQFKPR